MKRLSGQSEADSHAADSWLLDQTIRYHEERALTFGVVSCELWLSRRSGTANGENEDRDSSSFQPDVVYCWNQTSKGHNRNNSISSTSSTIPMSGNHRKVNPLYESKRADNNCSTMLGERSANRLWSRHKDSSDKSVQWRRFGPNTDSGDLDCTNSSARSSSRASSATSINWVGSIPFEVLSLESSGIHRHFHRGMVCWVFETTENNPLNHPSSRSECFLRSATSHIANTYALEAFQQLPLPKRRPSKPMCKPNPIDLTHTTLPHRDSTSSDSSGQPTKIKTQKTMPPELCYNDSVHSEEERPKTMSTLEINCILSGDEEEDDDRFCEDKIIGAVTTYFRKFKGGGHKGPQPLCWIQTLFTFIGSFITIYLIQMLNAYFTHLEDSAKSEIDISGSRSEIIRDWMNSDESSSFFAPLVMGPFGATCILIFAMTSAAPAQPRSLLIGAIIGMIVGKLIGYLEGANVGLGIRMSLAVSLTSAIMSRTCTLAPPGGALALIFSSQVLGWNMFLLQITGTLVAIGMGVIINNLHPMRTYPTFWIDAKGCKEIWQRKEACQVSP